MHLNILNGILLDKYSIYNVMDRSEIIELLEVINQQVSSSVLGGRDDDYEELESMGLITIDRDAVQWAATITPAGIAYLGHD